MYVGLSISKVIYFKYPFLLKNGLKLYNYKLVYETYGKLNKKNSNVILICHALNGSHHITGFYKKKKNNFGWWNNIIGPGKSINTDIFFIIGINNLGSCFGSTGPMHINSNTGFTYGSSFPILTIEDWVNSQFLLINKLNISKFIVILGGSLGGMQILSWSIMYPNYLNNCIIIASTIKLSSENIAFNNIARQVIILDSNFYNGNFYYYDIIPKLGLYIARMIGHITYLSLKGISKKFGNNLKYYNFCFNYSIDYNVESYLFYQAKKFFKYFDVNTYLLITKILDYFDLSKIFNKNLFIFFLNIKIKFLIICFNTDWRFPKFHSLNIIKNLFNIKFNINYIEINTLYGHDSFLLNNFCYIKIIKEYMYYIF